MWVIVALCLALSILLLSFAAAIYVIYRFLALALNMDAALLREFRFYNKTTNDIAKTYPTEGDFEPYSDETAFLNEQVEHLRRQGLTDEELEAFKRQAVSTDTVLPPKDE